MPFDYEIKRTARKSISITVSNSNKVMVRCPKTVDISRVEKFVKEKSDWIEKVLQKNALTLSANSDITGYEKIYVNGEKFALKTLADKNSFKNGVLYLKDIKNLKKLYLRAFADGLFVKITDFSDRYRLYPNNIAIKDYSSRWGCCDGKNNVAFNYKMLMLPADLQDYIIIHELCHIKHHNHSAEFWALVASLLPDYKQKRNRLKDFDFLTRLY